MFGLMISSVYKFSPGPFRALVRKAAAFTPRDVVLETFLKSPLRVRVDQGLTASSVKPLLVSSTLLRKTLVYKRLRYKEFFLYTTVRDKRINAQFLKARYTKRFEDFLRKAGALNNEDVSLGLYRGALISGLKGQEALIRGYPEHKLRSNINFNKALIKKYYESYSQI